MAYEMYRGLISKQEYFNKWDNNSTNIITDSLKETIYNKYKVKCLVFQRDEFLCQNRFCSTPEKDLTIHHIKWQKNDGKDTERNCVTLCRKCHSRYHKGKAEIAIKDREQLPSHIRGHTFVLQKKEEINWKKVKSEMRQLRKTRKDLWGYDLTDLQWEILMAFLFTPYEEFDE